MLTWQPSLLEGDQPGVDRSFAGLVRHQLDETAWVDHVPGWVRGAGALFEELVAKARWRSEERLMYGSMVATPRLTATWRAGERGVLVPVLAEILDALSERYGRPFDRGGLNLYRDGRDSVAWHRDRIPPEVEDPVVAIVSLGEARPFRLRPRGGGRSVALLPGPGDLLVTGGTAQRTWEHTVPKVKSAGPRISVTFRHG